jgi:hypothetical protein
VLSTKWLNLTRKLAPVRDVTLNFVNAIASIFQQSSEIACRQNGEDVKVI